MISNNSLKKIMKKTGALRIGKDAIKKLKTLTENYVIIITKKAIKNAEYSGRKSIKEEDISEAEKTEE